jgi:hypothetical protein
MFPIDTWAWDLLVAYGKKRKKKKHPSEYLERPSLGM